MNEKGKGGFYRGHDRDGIGGYRLMSWKSEGESRPSFWTFPGFREEGRGERGMW